MCIVLQYFATFLIYCYYLIFIVLNLNHTWASRYLSVEDPAVSPPLREAWWGGAVYHCGNVCGGRLL